MNLRKNTEPNLQIQREAKFTPEAEEILEALLKDPSRQDIYKAVSKAIELMESNLKHPSLNTHEFEGFFSPDKEKTFVAYAQNNTPRAYRILWYYGPGKRSLTIFSIVPHY